MGGWVFTSAPCVSEGWTAVSPTCGGVAEDVPDIEMRMKLVRRLKAVGSGPLWSASARGRGMAAPAINGKGAGARVVLE